MEASFPYEETPDQLRAAAEVKLDMEAGRPMDRLVVGDVGYGKTEVALRAAFKAIQDGKQVAVLVPTTVLAAQHHATFGQRFAAFPLKVRLLSRFVPQTEQKTTLAGLEDGSVDLVIGTHRLLSKDVSFRDLGLVVVDEEQRFGVAAKERLKQLRREVDVLTLSATPIPRTLNLALAGVRDMSVIETPPEDRLPIQTRVAEASAGLVRDAILRELDRGGQVFYVHNRVETIEAQTEQLRRMLPGARFVVGHGQMPEGSLERVMITFAGGEADVLVCTTIIESGLDIPNANTIVIDRADTLGLAQLYQLRGRVGRSSRRAYAYLLYRRRERMSEEARKRLQAIFNASELGAGFQIALADLEIRGRGQHPRRRAVGAHGGGRVRPLLAAAGGGGRGAEGAARGSGAAGRAAAGRRSTCRWRRISRTTTSPRRPRSSSCTGASPGPATRGDLAAFRQELTDRFGPMPQPVVRLVEVAELRLDGRGRGRRVDVPRGGPARRPVRRGAVPRDRDAAPGRRRAARRPAVRGDVREQPGPDPPAARPVPRVGADPGGRGPALGRSGRGRAVSAPDPSERPTPATASASRSRSAGRTIAASSAARSSRLAPRSSASSSVGPVVTRSATAPTRPGSRWTTTSAACAGGSSCLTP